MTKVAQPIRARGQEQARPVQQTDPESRPESRAPERAQPHIPPLLRNALVTSTPV